MNANKLPVVLVIGNPEENWYELCSDYKDQFIIEQAMWDEISLVSCSDSKGAFVTLYPSSRANCARQKETRSIRPSLVLIRMFSRYVSKRLGQVPDYRNILYGIYHSCTPMINSIDAVIAELEKPLMYGRLHYVQQKVGKDKFPLITQYYYPEYSSIICPPPAPFVLKVGFPHAGFGKVRINDTDELEDIKSIIAINNTYSSCEPLIDTDYELRIVFIAPDYYRVHKRTSMNWKVNFGMASEREDIEMNSRYKFWVDSIHDTFPDMETFDIDAIVDKNGKEYILEVNGSAQGFAPEHGAEDLEKMRDLVIRRLNQIDQIDISIEKSETQDDNQNNNDENDIKILNLKNEVQHLKTQLNKSQKYCLQLKSSNDYVDKELFKKKLCVLFIVLSLLAVIYLCFK